MNSKITFLLSEGKELLFESQANEVFDNVSPFKEILSKSDYEDLKVCFDSGKENGVSFEDLFHLRVNIKNVGGFDLLFKQPDFDKESIINQVLALKEMEVSDLESAKAKVDTLFAIFKDKLPLFVCYSPKGEHSLPLNELKIDTFVFLINKTEKPKPLAKEKPIKQKQNSGFFGMVIDFFSPVAENGIHYLFILISSFLIGFSSSIGIYYCYAGNNAFYFLFVCSLVGAVLNFFVYFDYFKKYKLISKDTALTIIDVLIGIAISIGSFFIFFAVQKEKPTSLNSPLVILLIMTAVILGINALACGIAFLIKGNGKPQNEDK